VAASLRDVFSVQAAKKRASLDLEGPAGPLPVRMGIGELEQVLSNLVINALDAVGEEDGRIVIRVEPGAEAVRISVEDNGPGVAASDAPHIFDPFFSTKAIGAGTGLGLAVVYGMVRDVGGEVVLERSALGGARFVVTLPSAPGESQ
jgi:signal transduction histidine kinase